MIYSVDHFAFLVSDMDNAIDFYQNTLGFKFMSRTLDEEHGEDFAYFELQGGNLELLRKMDRNPNEPINTEASLRANSPHLALKADDLNEIVKICKEKNVKIIDGPLNIPDKVEWMYIEDPDGNIIEFVKWLN